MMKHLFKVRPLYVSFASGYWAFLFLNSFNNLIKKPFFLKTLDFDRAFLKHSFKGAFIFGRYLFSRIANTKPMGVALVPFLLALSTS